MTVMYAVKYAVSTDAYNTDLLNALDHWLILLRSVFWFFFISAKVVVFTCPQKGCRVLQSARLSICLSLHSHISKTVQISPNFQFVLSVAVAWSSLDNNPICYVLLLMT